MSWSSYNQNSGPATGLTVWSRVEVAKMGSLCQEWNANILRIIKNFFYLMVLESLIFKFFRYIDGSRAVPLSTVV